MGYVGINNVAKKLIAIYCGDENGIARKIRRAYVGDDGDVARLWWDLTPIIPTPGAYPTLKTYWDSGHEFTSDYINIILHDYYVPEYVDDQWIGDEEGIGSIMCYRVGKTIYISGNGSGKIFAPADASHLFADVWLDTGNYRTVADIEGLNYLDTTYTTDMNTMFRGCQALVIDTSGFNTSNVTNMEDMFGDCDNITTLNLSNFDTTNVLSIAGMFTNCDNLQTLNLTSFNTAALKTSPMITRYDYAFAWCPSLQKVYVGDNWTLDEALMSRYEMFYESGCSTVTYV